MLGAYVLNRHPRHLRKRGNRGDARPGPRCRRAAARNRGTPSSPLSGSRPWSGGTPGSRLGHLPVEGVANHVHDEAGDVREELLTALGVA